jgi:elongation factor 2
MRKPNNIRNISIFADDHSGKSTVIEKLHEKFGLKKQRYAGEPCYTDDYEEEKEAGISRSYLNYIMYFYYQYAYADDSESDKDYLITLSKSTISSEFSSDVTSNLRIVDGIVVILDFTKEMSSKTETILR